MHLSEIVNQLVEVLPRLNITFEILRSHNGRPYYLRKIIQKREALNSIENTPGVAPFVERLKGTGIFENDADEWSFSEIEYIEIKEMVNDLLNSIRTVIGLYTDTHHDPNNSIKIKLPPHHTFEDLHKLTGQLRLAIETPVQLSKEDSTINILRAEPGSIWLVVAISSGAITLISKIIFVALEVRKRWINQNATLEYTKALGLKNELLSGIKDAFTENLKSYINTEINEISEAHFQNKEQASKAIEQSVTLFGELYEKNMEIQYAGEDETKLKLFPSLKDIKELKSGPKQIASKTEN